MSFAKLNFSIRWKILAGFMLSSMLPCILILNNVDIYLTLAVSACTALFFAFFSIYRIMRTLKKIQDTLHVKGTKNNEKDELLVLEQTLVHLSRYVEEHAEALQKSLGSSRSGEDAVLKKTYKAHLATGEPGYGELCLLPKRSTIELDQSMRLVGNAAKDVFEKALADVIKGLENMKELSSN